MPIAQIANEVLDDFPPSTRPGSGDSSRQTTDVDVILDKYVADGAQGVIKFLDYNVDEDGNSVDEKTARQRASGRIAPLKKRGYTQENGWVLASRNGAVYAKFFGPGNVPDEYKRKEPAVGENVPV